MKKDKETLIFIKEQMNALEDTINFKNEEELDAYNQKLEEDKARVAKGVYNPDRKPLFGLGFFGFLAGASLGSLECLAFHVFSPIAIGGVVTLALISPIVCLGVSLKIRHKMRKELKALKNDINTREFHKSEELISIEDTYAKYKEAYDIVQARITEKENQAAKLRAQKKAQRLREGARQVYLPRTRTKKDDEISK